nr:MAG TPA: hypothetical protein [Caudoviricetes sp.]
MIIIDKRLLIILDTKLDKNLLIKKLIKKNTDKKN